jgi:hypothetical protein
MVYACCMNLEVRFLPVLTAGNALLAGLLLRRPAP